MEQSANDENSQEDCSVNGGCDQPDPDAIYGGYHHWEKFSANLNDAVAVSIISNTLMKVNTMGEVAPVLTDLDGNAYGSASILHRSYDDKLYVGLTAGCTAGEEYCQCAVLEIDPVSNAVACAYQPDSEKKWSISAALYKNTDNSLLVNVARGDNSGEDIISVKDGVATTLYSNTQGILEVFPMENGGVFVEPVTDNTGNGTTLYLPKNGAAPVSLSTTSLQAVLTKLTGESDTYYYLVDGDGYHKFNPVSETLLTPRYMGKTFYSADGYVDVYYDTSGGYYQGYEVTDTNFLNPITIPAGNITADEATIVLTSDEHLAISSPSSEMFTIQVDDTTKATENWMLTNWGMHKFDLPNVPTAVNLGTDYSYLREVTPVNSQSVVLMGGSSNTPYYLKHYYPDAGSGALAVDLLLGVIDGDITIRDVKYDATRRYLTFYLEKTVNTTTERYIGVSQFIVTDEASHAGSFGPVSLIPVDSYVSYNSGFVFMP